MTKGQVASGHPERYSEVIPRSFWAGNEANQQLRDERDADREGRVAAEAELAAERITRIAVQGALHAEREAKAATEAELATERAANVVRKAKDLTTAQEELTAANQKLVELYAVLDRVQQIQDNQA
ncbi:hypothetical protein A4X09_0g1615 [Tilletia walkeri]|uniref:Uncharacterized protein n=1 Tax=Tilletia walkeri TaxID=117179 RepID=A0A8X7T6X3_9BASI|nr:hypothetical protein A4X09_0g1615 [Tilletia walkeri]